MAKRRSLGRGLDALLSQASSAPSAAVAAGADTAALSELPLDLLERGRYQPRVDMREESLAELAESIRAQGIVQPIVVRPLPKAGGTTEQRYEIVAGERRWRAAQMAGLESIPAVVRGLSDHAALAIALIENIQREDLNPIEEAASLSRLVEEFDMTHSAVADAVGRSRAAVSNLLRLLDLPAAVRTMLEQRDLDMGHARAILGVPSSQMQTEIAQRAVAQGWSVRATEQAVRAVNSNGGSAQAAATRKNPDILRMEQELAERLGAPVEVDHKGKSGRLVIRFHSLEELEGILEHIK